MSSHDLRAALRVACDSVPHEHTCLQYGTEPKKLDVDPTNGSPYLSSKATGAPVNNCKALPG